MRSRRGQARSSSAPVRQKDVGVNQLGHAVFSGETVRGGQPDANSRSSAAIGPVCRLPVVIATSVLLVAEALSSKFKKIPTIGRRKPTMRKFEHPLSLTRAIAPHRKGVNCGCARAGLEYGTRCFCPAYCPSLHRGVRHTGKSEKRLATRLRSWARNFKRVRVGDVAGFAAKIIQNVLD
jgi:hypothetical protein